MTKIASEVFYRDFDFTFNAHPITGKLLIKKNNESVKQALKLLIMTNLYERPYRSRLGGNIPNSLFENYMPFTQEKIRSSIETAINNYEGGRCELLDVRFQGSPDERRMEVTVIVRPLNATNPIEINLTLARIR